MSIWPYFPPRSWYDQVTASLGALKTKVSQIAVTEQQIQADVTAISAVLDGVAADQAELVTDAQAIQAEIAAGNPVDTTALDALVTRAQGIKTALDTATASVGALVTPPPPPPAG